MMDFGALRYPIGRATRRALLSPAERADLIGRIAGLPALVRDAVSGLDGRPAGPLDGRVSGV